MKTKYFFPILLSAFLLLSFNANAVDYVSNASGDWGTATIWTPNGTPGQFDNITILNSHIITGTSQRLINNITINSGGTLNYQDLIIYGLLTNNGSFTYSGISTTQFIHAGMVVTGNGIYNIAGGRWYFFDNQTIDAGVIINSVGQIVLYNTAAFPNVNLTNNGSLNFTGGIIVASAINPCSFTNGVNATLKIGVTIPSVVTLNASAIGNTICFFTSTSYTIATPASSQYYNLTITGGGTKTLPDNLVVLGDINIQGVIDIQNKNLSIAGNWTNSLGVAVNANASTIVTFNGSAAQLISRPSGVETFGNVVFSGSGTKTLGTALSLYGLTINSGATLDAGAPSYKISIVTDWLNNGGIFIPRSGIVSLDGAAQTITNMGGETFYNLVVAGSASTKTLGGAISLAGTLTINSSHILDVSASNYGISTQGNWTNNGVFTGRNGTVTFNGTGTQTIGGSASTPFYNLTKNGSGTTNLAVNTTISNLLNISSGILNAGTYGLSGAGGITQTNGELRVTKLGVTVPELSGAYAISGGKVTFNGAGSQTLRSASYYNVDISGTGTKTAGGALDINGNLTISGALDVSASNYALSVAGNWINNGTYTPRNGTITFDGTGAQTIGGSATTSFYNVTKGAAGTATLAKNEVVSNLLTISSGILDASTFGLTGTAGLTQTSGEIKIAKTGVIVPELSGAYAISGGKVTFYGAGSQTVRSTSYNDVDIAGSGTKTAGGALDINGISTITSTLDASASNYTINLAGNWINNGTFISRNGTVIFDGATTVSGFSTTNFYNTTISGTLTGHAATMNVAGNFVNNGIYTHNNGTVVFNGATTVSGASTTSFNNVTISGTLSGHATAMNIVGNLANNGTYTHNSGTIVFNGTTTVSGASPTTFNNVTISGTLTGHLTNMNVIGDFINNGVYNNNGGTITFKGAAVAAQSISSAGLTTFYGLTINNTGGGVMLSTGSYVLSDVLTLSNGTFNINSLPFTMVATPAKYSRIAPVTGTGAISNANTFNVQRYVSARDTTWCDMASPNNGTMANWDNNLYFTYPHNPVTYYPFSNVVEYNEALYRYEGTNAATALTPGKGFEIFLTDDASFSAYTPVTLTTTGTPNIAVGSIALSYTPAAGLYKGENLVGNPYASAVTVGSMGFTNASSTVDVYDYTIGNYSSVSGAGTIGPGQGFWVYATGAGASVLIPETAKSIDQTLIIRSNTNKSIDSYMTLKLSSADNSHQLAYTFKAASNENALDGWDEQDHLFRKSHNRSAPNITSRVEDKDLAINTFSSINDNYSMPLTTQTGISGFYKIEVGGLEYMNQYKYIALEDKLLNKMIDLKTNQLYVFKMNSSDKQDRFVLHFSKDTQLVIASNILSNGFGGRIDVLPTVQGSVINFNLGETTNTTITVTNLLGQTIVDAIIVAANNQSVNISLPEEFKGIYILRIESDKGNITKKFVRE